MKAKIVATLIWGWQLNVNVKAHEAKRVCLIWESLGSISCIHKWGGMCKRWSPTTPKCILILGVALAWGF